MDNTKSTNKGNKNKDKANMASKQPAPPQVNTNAGNAKTMNTGGPAKQNGKR